MTTTEDCEVSNPQDFAYLSSLSISNSIAPAPSGELCRPDTGHYTTCPSRGSQDILYVTTVSVPIVFMALGKKEGGSTHA